MRCLFVCLTVCLFLSFYYNFRIGDTCTTLHYGHIVSRSIYQRLSVVTAEEDNKKNSFFRIPKIESSASKYWTNHPAKICRTRWEFVSVCICVSSHFTSIFMNSRMLSRLDSIHAYDSLYFSLNFFLPFSLFFSLLLCHLMTWQNLGIFFKTSQIFAFIELCEEPNFDIFIFTICHHAVVA